MAARLEQLIVRTLLDDAAGLEHHQPIHACDGRQAVCDRDHRLALHEPEQLLLYRELDFAVERRGSLVEHEDGSILEDDSSDRHALALPAGELHAALAHMRLVTPAAMPVRRPRKDPCAVP